MQFKIIYVDDEPALCEMLKDNFSSDLVMVQTFVDPEAALSEIAASPPDLLFLDYRIGHISGDEVASKVDNRIPKVLITGDLKVSPLQNFVRIFHKPFDFDEVEKFIDGYLRAKIGL